LAKKKGPKKKAKKAKKIVTKLDLAYEKLAE